MACYIVSYDLNKEAKRPDILSDIKKYSWARLSESSYAIKTSQSPAEVFNALKKHVDSNDNLYIINLRKPYAGRGPKDVNDWLDESLPG